jgi:hypothetical protein
MVRTIVHLCADIGSDSYPYQCDSQYNVVLVGKEIGVENYSPPTGVHGIIANPVCTEFSTASGFHKKQDADLTMVKHCQRIIAEANPAWWVIENPANGTMCEYLGEPTYAYQPWWYGSPWTKRTALWGQFNIPERLFTSWDEVETNDALYVRPGRPKCALAFLHKSAIADIPEFAPFVDRIDTDNAFRSLCSQGFAMAFKGVNP